MTSQPLSPLQQLLEAKDTPGQTDMMSFSLKGLENLAFGKLGFRTRQTPLDTEFFISLVI